jgi:hypothetical protein
VNLARNGKFKKMTTQQPIHYLKRLAKKRARDERIPLSQALDDIAKQHGATSWSLLLHQRETAGEPKIQSLPVTGPSRTRLRDFANEMFEYSVRRMEAEHPDITRSLWNVDTYLDDHFLGEEFELPMDIDYAENLMEATLWHHVVDLAVEADKLAMAD